MYELEEMILRIKKVKKNNNLSNEELSKLSGVPLGTLAKILGSETKDPRISNIIGIAKALNVSADYLIFGDEANTLFSTTSLASGETKLLSNFRYLNPKGQDLVSNYAESLTHADEYKKCPDTEDQDVG